MMRQIAGACQPLCDCAIRAIAAMLHGFAPLAPGAVLRGNVPRPAFTPVLRLAKPADLQFDAVVRQRDPAIT